MKNKKGFTLVELIVVIAILATLVALAMPTFNGILNNSKEKIAQSNVLTVFTASQSYYVINDGKYPLTSVSGKAGDTITMISFEELKELMGAGFTGSCTAYAANGAVVAAQWFDGSYSAVYNVSENTYYCGKNDTYAGALGYQNGVITVNGVDVTQIQLEK